jgi:long-chain acyl-CoA synthetase
MPTLPERLARTAAARGDAPAFRQAADGRWSILTWAEAERTARRLAAGLAVAGVRPRDRVLLWGRNSARWVLGDLAILTGAGVTVPVYETSSAEQAEHILRATDAPLAFLGPRQYQAAAAAWQPGRSALRTVVLLEGPPPAEPMPGVRVLTWEELEALAGDSDAKPRPPKPDDPATIVFTSGTAGVPKGAVFDHRAVARITDALLEVVPATADDRVLSYLPLAHSIERLLSVYLPVTVGGSVWFAEGAERVPANLRDCRPTVFVGVPRVWEKFVEGIDAKSAQAPRYQRALLAAARSFGRSRRRGPLRRLFDRLVFRRLRRAVGLDRARLLLSGGAPIRCDTVAELHALGLPVLDAYGQTETVVTSLNTPAAHRSGSVGRPLPGMAVRTAADGEIEVRSETLFRGYWGDEAATREAFTPDGWLRTGDLGRLDADGFLHITGRKKALLITSGGKNVAPEPLEAELAAVPGVAQAMVIGDGRKYLAALLTLDAAAARRLAPDGPADAESLAADARVLTAVRAGVEAVNRRRAPCEQVKRFRLLPRPFTAEAGEVTPTQKVRRAVVAERHADLIERLYTAPAGEAAVTAAACA